MNTKKKRPALIFLLFSGFVIFLIIMADLNRLPVKLLKMIPRYDLIAHFVIYGLLFRLLDDFIFSRKVDVLGKKLPLAMMIALGLTLAEEVSQLFLVSRTFSLMDLFFGVLGIYFFYRHYPERFFIFCVKKVRKIP